MLAIRDLLAWAPGSPANRENRYNASGSYLFLDSSCSPHPVPRKLTLTGLFALHSLAGWASQLHLRTANESYHYVSCATGRHRLALLSTPFHFCCASDPHRREVGNSRCVLVSTA